MTLIPSRPVIMTMLWGIAIVAWGTTAAAVVRAHRARQSGSPRSIASVDTIMMYDPTLLRRASDSVIAMDFFRVARHPTQVAFGTPVAAAPVIAPPARPILTFGGVIGGPPWRAVLSGIPNHDGSVVVAPGDTLGGLRVRTIRHDTVIVRGRDTTWTFTVKH